MKKSKKVNKISLIVPCYNEEESIIPFYKRIISVFDKINDADFELFFINDGSKDKTFELISSLHDSDARVRCVSFSRNFGKEAALFAGIRAVTGDCAVILDADLQHPPEKIIDMYALWKQGFEVIEGIKSDRGKESAFHKLCSKIFYHAISHAIEMDMNNSSDFKLIDRKVINQLSSIKERDTFFRALSFWVGFKTTKVYFEVQDRVAGKSKWSISSLFKYALHNVSSYSYKPLYSILSFSFIFFVLSIIIGVDTLISYAHHCSVSGYPTLIFIILISSSFILFSLGIIGIYIAKIYDEVKGRPQYIIERVL